MSYLSLDNEVTSPHKLPNAWSMIPSKSKLVSKPLTVAVERFLGTTGTRFGLLVAAL